VNKRELIEAFANEFGITIRNAEVCVNTLFNSMADALSKGGRVEIRGFGSFKVKSQDWRTHSSPQ
jgi:integration host factor subunit beta